jgi:hypothetical protein
MVVRKDDRSRVIGQCRLDDFARINGSLRQRAGEQFIGFEQTILRVKPQGDEDFVAPGWPV